MDIREERFSKTLDVTLTNEQLLRRGESLARAIEEQTEIADEHAERRKDMKNEADEAQVTVNKLAHIVRTGIEQKDVDCVRIYDYHLGTVTERRLDTMDVLTTREMTDDERQRTLWER